VAPQIGCEQTVVTLRSNGHMAQPEVGTSSTCTFVVLQYWKHWLISNLLQVIKKQRKCYTACNSRQPKEKSSCVWESL